MKNETFDVFGMTCAACQANVTKAVSKLEGVNTVDVSLISNTMKVDYDPSVVTPQSIEEAVSAIGYKAALQSAAINEAEPDSLTAVWDARQKRVKEEIQERKKALVISIVLLLVLMCFSMLPMIGIFTVLMDMEWMMISGIIQLVLCMCILFAQRSFFIHGFKSLFHRAPNMDSLVAIGSAVSFAYGLYGLLRMAYGYGVMDHAIIHESMDALYFESASMIVTLVSLGKYLEARSKAKTGDALGKLVDLAPKTALVERNGVPVEVAANQVVSGDHVIIRPGMRIPVDGIVFSGTGYVDQSALTGESIPVEKQVGDQVISASMNINGSFVFEATNVGSDTTLAQIIRLVDEAGNSKAPIARLADKVSGVFVPVVLGLALLTLCGWLIAGGSLPFAINCAVSVLVISCPCALGLATPLAIMVSTGKAAEYGILIKSAASLESLHSIDTIVFDKTGTITSGKPQVMDVRRLETALSENEFLQLAAAAESGSEHPLGKAVVNYVQEKGLPIVKPETFEAIGGRGLKATVHQTDVVAGNAAFMEEEKIQLTPADIAALEQAASAGQTPLLFAVDGKLAGMICVADAIRPTSQKALQLLKANGITTVMLTGDNAKTAHAVAADLDVAEVISDVLPADKESVIRRLQQEGHKTAMVGDGINDAPALARADVGIAIGAGTDIAIDSADIVLMKDNLLDVVNAIELSRATIRNIKENLFWAFFYNVLGIPVAMGLFYGAFGWLLNPMIGAAAMSISSVTVCLNALRLRFFKPSGITEGQIQEVPAPEVQQEKQAIAQSDERLEEQEEKEVADSVVLRVEGMSCAHCQNRVQQALEKVDGVIDVQVSLDPSQAFVLGRKKLDVQALIAAIQDAGYEASLPTEEPGTSHSTKEPAWQIEFGVEGMSCAHCQNRVEAALQAIEGVQSVQVSLENSSVLVQADTPIAQNVLAKAVEEAGYTPVLTKEGKHMTRTLIVEGMSCAHCAARVENALKAVPGVDAVTVNLADKHVTVECADETSIKELASAVTQAGYSVSSFE